MGYDGQFTKQSAEEFLIAVDFAQECLTSAEDVASYTVAATKLSDSSTVTTTVLQRRIQTERM